MWEKYISPSLQSPRYFADADGRGFIPIGVNLCFDRMCRPEKEFRALYRHWLESFAANHGNFIRIWLGVPAFDVMPSQEGVFDKQALANIRQIVTWCEELGIKIKFTLEHFRTLNGNPRMTEAFPGVISFLKTVCAPYANNMREFMASRQCREIYLSKARYLAENGLGDSPAVIAWELWNEINCLGGVDAYGEWSDYMLSELSQLFPHQMVLQNLGSFSSSKCYRNYDNLAEIPLNGFMQIHRYLDPGAELDVCRAPMDVLASSAIRELHLRKPNAPAVLAETGAVEANHSRYSDLYAVDDEGTLLHDALFAPFFAGSAGCGQFWHWDHIYIDRLNLWWHFSRFAAAIEGIDVIAEDFRPYYTETHQLRIYGLRGKHTQLAWCRDKVSTWESELRDKIPAEELSGQKVPFEAGDGIVRCYLPWTDTRAAIPLEAGQICTLPSFKRSCVIRSNNSPA